MKYIVLHKERKSLLEQEAEEFLKAKGSKKKSAYLNSDGTFKGGFDGCVKYQMQEKGIDKKGAEKLCAFIGRRAGKI